MSIACNQRPREEQRTDIDGALHVTKMAFHAPHPSTHVTSVHFLVFFISTLFHFTLLETISVISIFTLNLLKFISNFFVCKFDWVRYF